jgi:putative ABC transport system permease protein
LLYPSRIGHRLAPLHMLAFYLENFRLGLHNLLLHRLRSLLTALGIIFGVLAVIVMVALGQGGKEAARRQVEQLGATNILVTSVRPPESNDATGSTSRVLAFGIKRDDLARLNGLPNLASIVPLRDTKQQIVLNSKRFTGCNAIATTPDWFNMINLPLDRGSVFTQIQYDRAEAVCVLGAKAAEQMFPFSDPLGRTITLGAPSSGQTVVTVIGVLQPTGLRAGDIISRDLDLDLYFPLTTSRLAFGDAIVRRQAGSFERQTLELSEVWLKARSTETVESVANIAQNILGMPARADVGVKAPIEILRRAEAVNFIFNIVMVGIASLSLIVGGIGIMNIMLATVTERTREIGIRRALGAKQWHIRLQFLIETAVLSLLGGFIGIALGVGIALILPWLIGLFTASGDFTTKITAWSVIVSFVVSGMIGIVFGMYPALKASSMNPIDALRHE